MAYKRAQKKTSIIPEISTLSGSSEYMSGADESFQFKEEFKIMETKNENMSFEESAEIKTHKGASFEENLVVKETVNTKETLTKTIDDSMEMEEDFKVKSQVKLEPKEPFTNHIVEDKIKLISKKLTFSSVNIYLYLTLFTAVIVAGGAAYFSVFGLSKLFSAAKLSIIIMAGSLEFGKIVAVSYLNRFWKNSPRGLRWYLLSAIFVLMVITSMGIYGYLSNAYELTAHKMTNIETQSGVYDMKIQFFEGEIKRIEDQITEKNVRSSQLNSLRRSQESRLDSLYKKGYISSAKRTEDLINNADNQIAGITADISVLSNKIPVLNDSIAKYKIEDVNLNSDKVAIELGPLKYIARLTGQSMDVIANVFILLLIFVFDPLAMSFIIVINNLTKMRNS